MKKTLMINISALTTALVVCCGTTIYTAKEIDLSYAIDPSEEIPQILEQESFDLAGKNDIETTPLSTFELNVINLNNFNNKEDFTISSEVLLEMQQLSSNNGVSTFSYQPEETPEPEIEEEIVPEIEEEPVPEIEEEPEPEIEEEPEPEIEEEPEPEIEEEPEPEIEEEIVPEIEEEIVPEIEEEIVPEIEENLEPDFSQPQIDVDIRVEEDEEPEEDPEIEEDEYELQDEVADNNNSTSNDSSKPSYVITTTESERATLLNLVAGAVQKEIVGNNTTPRTEYYEAYKAQAVAARSYMEYHKNLNGSYPSMTYTTPHADTIKLTDMVLDEIMYYDSKPINATYHASAGGATQSAVYVWGTNVPYLKGVESKYDTTPYVSTMKVSDVESKLSANKVNVSGDPSTWFDLSSATKTDGGFIDTMQVCGHTVKGRALRETILGTSILRSPKITDITVSGDTFTFTSVGYGHGVGLSQNGALGYSKNDGYSYKDILNHYYTGITIY